MYILSKEMENTHYDFQKWLQLETKHNTLNDFIENYDKAYEDEEKEELRKEIIKDYNKYCKLTNTEPSKIY